MRQFPLAQVPVPVLGVLTHLSRHRCTNLTAITWSLDSLDPNTGPGTQCGNEGRWDPNYTGIASAVTLPSVLDVLFPIPVRVPVLVPVSQLLLKFSFQTPLNFWDMGGSSRRCLAGQSRSDEGNWKSVPCRGSPCKIFIFSRRQSEFTTGTQKGGFRPVSRGFWSKKGTPSRFWG